MGSFSLLFPLFFFCGLSFDGVLEIGGRVSSSSLLFLLLLFPFDVVDVGAPLVGVPVFKDLLCSWVVCGMEK